MKYNKFLFLCIILSLIAIAFSGCNYGLNNDTIQKPQNVVEQEITANDIEQAEPQIEVQEVSPELKVYFFDVGQGDSIFVQNGDECMLIDAGNNPDGKYISKYLRKELNIKNILDKIPKKTIKK